MNHIGLFEGMGGFSLAARWMGWNTIAWCEINPFGQRVLAYHFPNAKPYHDIKQSDFTIHRGKCGILTGGFPCQPYSISGQQLGNEDERHLWPEMLRAIKEIQPRWIVGENVLGILNWNGGLVFNEVQADLEAAGYEVWAYVLPAHGVGAYHLRDRVWFVAHSKRFGLQEPNTRPRQKRRVPKDSPTVLYSDRFAQWRFDKRGSGLVPTGDGVPGGLDLGSISYNNWKKETIKGAGNAVVPHVPFQIYKAIEAYEINQT